MLESPAKNAVDPARSKIIPVPRTSSKRNSSVPAPPSSVSLPRPPAITSSPAPPCRLLALLSPIIVSFPVVPTTFSILRIVSSSPPSTVTVVSVAPFNVTDIKFTPPSPE